MFWASDVYGLKSPWVMFLTLCDGWDILPCRFCYDLNLPHPSSQFFPPEKCERELWETGGGRHTGLREGTVGKNRTQPPLKYYQPRQDVMRINEASPGAEMDDMTSGSPLTESWNSQSQWGQTRAPRSPDCVNCHVEASLWQVCF